MTFHHMQCINCIMFCNITFILNIRFIDYLIFFNNKNKVLTDVCHKMLCMTNKIVQFILNNLFFRQTDGVAMGSRLTCATQNLKALEFE